MITNYKKSIRAYRVEKRNFTRMCNKGFVISWGEQGKWRGFVAIMEVDL